MEIPRDVRSDQGRARIVAFRRTTALVFVLFAALTVLQLIPLSVRPFDMVHDPGDPLLNTWILSWVGHQVFQNPGALFEANIFYPHRDALAFSEHMLPLALAAEPLNLLFHNPVLAYNIVLELTFVFSAFGMFLLVRKLTGNALAGIASGIVFAFSSYKIMHVSHLQLLAAMGLPLSFFYLHRFLEDRRFADAVLFAFFFALQALACIYYGLFSIAVFSLILPLALLFQGRSLKASVFMKLGIPFLIAGGCLFFFSLPYARAFKALGLNRGLTAGAEFQNYFAAGPTNLLWGRLLSPLGMAERYLFPGLAACVLAAFALFGRKKVAALEPKRTTRPLVRALVRAVKVVLGFFVAINLVSIVAALGGGARISWGPVRFSMTSMVKPVLSLLLLAGPLLAIAILRLLRSPEQRGPRRWILLYAALTFWAAMLSFGSGFTIFGKTTAIVPMPFTFFFRHVLGFNGIREPARFAVYVLFGISALAGFGWAAIAGRMASQSLRRTLGIVLIAVLNIECLSIPIEGNTVPVGKDVPPTYAWLKTQSREAVVLELPLLDWLPGESLYLYFSTYHWKRLINGYSGFIPASTFMVRDIFREFPSRESVDALSALGVNFVVVHAKWLPPEWVGVFAKYIESRFGDTLRLEKRFEYASARPHLYQGFLGDDLVFSVRPGVSKPTLAERQLGGSVPRLSPDRWRIEASDNPRRALLMTDGNLNTSWTTGKPRRPGAYIRIDLGGEYDVRQISLSAGTEFLSFGLDFQVETSDDGANWRVVTFRYDKTEFLLDLIKDQVRATQDLQLKDGYGRYLRIVQTGTGDEMPWSIAEISLFGWPVGPPAGAGPT
jgi:hypothetical protein